MKRYVFLLLITHLFHVKVYSQSTTFSKDYRIRATDAHKHIGEWHEVRGSIFKVEIKKYKPKLDSALVSVHLTNDNKRDVDFIIFTKINTKKDSYFINLINHYKTAKYETVQTKGSFWDENSTEGKIFLYKGKPAILIRAEDFKILEMVD